MAPTIAPRRWAVRSMAVAFALAVLLLPAVQAPPSAHAAALVVNTLADADPPATDGLCSLREAITNANNNAATHPDCAAGVGTDTITFSVSGTIVLTAALPDIADAAGLTIDGSGQAVTVSGNNAVRPFWVSAGALLDLRQLTVKNGLAMSSGGGGIYSEGTLFLTNSTIADNTALSTGGSSGGGGIYNNGGAMTVTHSAISGNTAPAYVGGGIFSRHGTLTVSSSTLTGNTSYGTGGGMLSDSLATVSNSTISGNTGNEGGGISNFGTLTLANSAVTGNSASGEAGKGGGVYNHGPLTLVNSSISGNTGYEGGGIFVDQPLTVLNSTIAGNNAVGGQGGGGIYNPSSTVTLTNSILANNTSPVYRECYGNLTMIGPNLLGSPPSGCTVSGPPPMIGDPSLGPLADNGGPTKTHALLPGSLAIDAGDDTVCASALLGGKDQRGVARPHGVRCDLGAFERIPLPLGLVAHYTADVLGGQPDGTKVGHWDDLSGNGHHAIQAITTSRPTIRQNAVNGRPSVVFDRAQQAWLGTGVHGSLSGSYWSVVAVVRATAPEQGSLFSEGRSDQNQYSDIRLVETPPRVQWVGKPAGGSEQQATATGSLTLGTFYTVHVQRAGSTLRIRHNGITNTVTGVTTTYVLSPTTSSIGVLNRGSLQEFLAAEVAELLIYDHDLGGLESTTVEEYLRSKYLHYGEPGLSVTDLSLPEGNAGTTSFTFTVSLSAPSATPVTVHVATADGTATAPSDYVAVPDTLLTFAPGETSKPFSVQVNGDTAFEPNETFFVNLSNPTGAVIADGQGVGTILNDDIPGGRNLRITTGSVDLSWDTGTAQTGYYLLRYNTDTTTAADLIPLAGHLTSYSDAAAVNGTVYCYVLAAMNGGSVLGLSDLLCGLTGVSSGSAVPGGFALTLNQTAGATMTWTPPAGGVGSYLLQRIPLDGTPISSVPLGAGVTSTTQPVTSAGTCFQLIAYRVLEFGTTNVLCGVPGVSTLSAGGRVASIGEVTDTVAALAGRLQAAAVFGAE